MSQSKPPSPQKRISLALQGGGAHGTFTWGVLDALLEDGRIGIEAISGTSAGAMNAIALADGMAENGNEGARKQLERFWRHASRDSGLPDVARQTLDVMLTPWNAAGTWWMDAIAKTATPYDFNPLDINPLKDILEAEIDFARIRKNSPVRLHIAATNVETGKIRIFETKELTAAHIAASAALPQIFQAARIGEEYFWDGGYMGNPALYPLYYDNPTNDILLVQINPVVHSGVPKSPEAIQNRLNEITFNATLLRELRAIDFVNRLIEEGRLKRAAGPIQRLFPRESGPRLEYKRVLMHCIDLSHSINGLAASTKLSTEWTFFLKLKEAGRAAAIAWLDAHFDDLGQRATMNIRSEIG